MCVIPAGGLQVQNEPGLPIKLNCRKQKQQNHTHTENLNVCLKLGAREEALAKPLETLGMSSDLCKHLRATPEFLSVLAQGGPCSRLALLYPESMLSVKGLGGIPEKCRSFLTTQKVWLLAFYWKEILCARYLWLCFQTSCQ